MTNKAWMIPELEKLRNAIERAEDNGDYDRAERLTKELIEMEFRYYTDGY